MNIQIVSTQGLQHGLRPESRGVRAVAVAVCAAALTVGLAGCTKADMGSSQQVLLEAAASAGGSPWMESVSSANLPTEVSRVEQVSPGGAAETQDETVTVAGDQVGLYGGTPGVAACDREKMVNFLETHPQQGTAWKNVTGAKDIRSYAQTLSPVVLTQDTRVTNHGFDSGQPTPFQSVLQTGTAVLIDDRGVPRVRCACGNPLAEPQSATKPEFTGAAWKTFKKTSLVSVRQSVQTLDKVELVSVPVIGALPPSTLFAAITPGEVTPEPAPQTTLPQGATLERVPDSSQAGTEGGNSGPDTDSPGPSNQDRTDPEQDTTNQDQPPAGTGQNDIPGWPSPPLERRGPNAVDPEKPANPGQDPTDPDEDPTDPEQDTTNQDQPPAGTGQNDIPGWPSPPLERRGPNAGGEPGNPPNPDPNDPRDPDPDTSQSNGSEDRPIPDEEGDPGQSSGNGDGTQSGGSENPAKPGGPPSENPAEPGGSENPAESGGPPAEKGAGQLPIPRPLLPTIPIPPLPTIPIPPLAPIGEPAG